MKLGRKQQSRIHKLDEKQQQINLEKQQQIETAITELDQNSNLKQNNN